MQNRINFFSRFIPNPILVAFNVAICVTFDRKPSISLVLLLVITFSLAPNVCIPLSVCKYLCLFLSFRIDLSHSYYGKYKRYIIKFAAEGKMGVDFGKLPIYQASIEELPIYRAQIPGYDVTIHYYYE